MSDSRRRPRRRLWANRRKRGRPRRRERPRARARRADPEDEPQERPPIARTTAADQVVEAFEVGLDLLEPRVVDHARKLEQVRDRLEVEIEGGSQPVPEGAGGRLERRRVRERVRRAERVADRALTDSDDDLAVALGEDDLNRGAPGRHGEPGPARPERLRDDVDIALECRPELVEGP